MPTLKNENRLIVNRFLYRFTEPKKGDIIVFEFSEDKNFIKRIIGVPGDEINIDENNGDVYLNGEVIEEDYIKEKIRILGNIDYPVKVTEDHYFVMGDNRNNSTDSRKKSVGDNGLVRKKSIRGKAFFRIWPFKTFGSL